MTDVRYHAAKRLLGDGTVEEAFAEIRADMMREWDNTPEDATAKRESIWRTIKATERLKAKLESYVLDGEMAARR